MLKIYGFAPSFNTSKVLLTAEELGINYEYINYDLSAGEHMNDEHKGRHPLHKTPAIDHDGRTLFESNTICRYLAAFSKSDMYPEADAWKRANIDQWSDYVIHHPGKHIATLLWEKVVKEMMRGEKGNETAINEATNFLNTQLPVLDDQLAKNTFLAGDTITIADTIAFSYLATSQMINLDLSTHKNITKWQTQLSQQEAFQKVLKMTKI